MSKNISSAARFLQKEIERLEKERELWSLKASIAKENLDRTYERKKQLEEQLEILEPKTAFASL